MMPTIEMRQDPDSGWAKFYIVFQDGKEIMVDATEEFVVLRVKNTSMEITHKFPQSIDIALS
ncbi:hypothetical protein [Emticicia sp. 17c]|uniref:hypothetical protein n=1 Tax=Emticicia sp. 17c TaxID=3127704 RepID=UPI00301C10E1